MNNLRNNVLLSFFDVKNEKRKNGKKSKKNNKIKRKEMGRAHYVMLQAAAAHKHV